MAVDYLHECLRSTDALADRRAQLNYAYAIYNQSIIRYLGYRTRDDHLAEDLAQELWISVYTDFRLNQFQNLALLLVRAKQIQISHFRSASVRAFVQQAEDGDLERYGANATRWESDDPTIEQSLEQEFWSQFWPTEFSQAQRMCTWLSLRYGFTLEEIARKTGIPKATAGELIEKCRSVCIQRLANEF